MKFGKTIRKVAALGVGLSMLGATLVGAMATDLGDLPGLFVDTETGAFDGVFVQPSTGADGSAEGIVSGWFAVAAVKKVPLVEDADERDVLDVEGEQIGTGNDLNLGDNFNTVVTTMGSDFDLLTDGELTDQEGTTKADEAYKQYIHFRATATDYLRFAQNEDDGAEFANYYLHFDDGSSDWMFTYELVFDDNWQYVNQSAVDLTGAQFQMMGMAMTVLGATFTGSTISELDILSGENLKVFSEGESLTLDVNGVDTLVTFTNVNEAGTACIFNVAGDTVVIDDNTAETVSGLTIGVTEVHALHAGEAELEDLCKAVVGGRELTFKHGNIMKINDENSDDLTGMKGRVDFAETTSGSNQQITLFNFSVRPDNEIYLVKGDTWVEPITEAVQFVFSDLVRENVESVSLTASGENGKLEFTQDDGKGVDLRLVAVKGGTATDVVRWGKDTDGVDDYYYFQGESCVGTSSITECEGAKFLVGDDEDLHIIEVTDIDVDNNKVDFKDLTYGVTRDELSYTAVTLNQTTLTDNNSIIKTHLQVPQADSFTIPGMGAFKLLMDEGNNTVYFQDLDVGTTASYKGNFSMNASSNTTHLVVNTKYDGLVRMYDTNQTQRTFNGVSFAEYNDGELTSTKYLLFTNSGHWNVTGVYDDVTDNSIEFNFTVNKNPNGQYNNTKTGGTYGYGPVDASEEEDEMDYYVSFKGTECLYDSQDMTSFVCKHPRDAAYAVVKLADAQAQLTAGVSGGYTLEPVAIPGSVHLFAEEVDDVSSVNSVLLGGPCANAGTAEVLGNPADCLGALGIQEGQAVLKLVGPNANGKWALVVAGFKAADTRNAATWLVDQATSEDLDGKMEVFLHTVERSNVRVLDLSELAGGDEAAADTTGADTTE